MSKRKIAIDMNPPLTEKEALIVLIHNGTAHHIVVPPEDIPGALRDILTTWRMEQGEGRFVVTEVEQC
jgi:hypothetical protein